MSNRLLRVLVCHLYFDHGYEISDIEDALALSSSVIKDYIDQEKDSYEQRFA